MYAFFSSPFCGLFTFANLWLDRSWSSIWVVVPSTLLSWPSTRESSKSSLLVETPTWEEKISITAWSPSSLRNSNVSSRRISPETLVPSVVWEPPANVLSALSPPPLKPPSKLIPSTKELTSTPTLLVPASRNWTLISSGTNSSPFALLL